MRILYHHRTQAEDGQAVHVRALLRAFAALGHEVLEVGLVRHGSAAPAARGTSWRLVARLPRFLRELAEYGYNGIGRRRVVGAAARFDPAFLYERYAFGNVSGVLAARRLGRPLMLEVNSPLALELSRTRGLSFPGVAQRVERFVWQGADRVCAVSGVLRDLLVAEGVEPGRVAVIRNGVDLERYAYPDRPAARAAARAELGLAPAGEGELVVGFVGYYRPWHRLDLAIAALAAPELAGVRLVLVGEGPAREELAAAAAARGLGPRVTFAGARPHARIPALLPAFDVALLPAINAYASPLKLQEYMAAGLPAIAPDQPNLREIVRPGENGILVPPGDGDALAAAILALAGDAGRRVRLGAAARRTIEEEGCTWLGNARRVVEIMEELVR
ncbi:MAG: glycosyltransferase [Planctomycetota bacterium]